ncbi:MAG: hypothetical protein ABII79_00240 [bacterium]
MRVQSSRKGVWRRLVLLAMLSISLFSFTWQATLADGNGGTLPPPPPPGDSTGSGSSIDPGGTDPGSIGIEPEHELTAWDLIVMTLQILP